MKFTELLYEGKGKRVFNTESADVLGVEFKDNLTAFNAVKLGNFSGKGQVNCEFTDLIFKELEAKGVKTHWIEKTSDNTGLIKKLEMIPLEVVVRNVLAGSTAKKFKREEGEVLPTPLFELFYKDDDLGDPFISNEQAMMLGCVEDESVIAQLKVEALKVNSILLELFKGFGIQLVDFKLEYGFDSQGNVVLGDEFSPDGCRLWSITEGKDQRFDKDLFRHDYGDVEAGYKSILNQLKDYLKV